MKDSNTEVEMVETMVPEADLEDPVSAPSPSPSRPATPATPPPQERLHPDDVNVLERANVRRQLTHAQAEKASADNEVAELQYKNIIMQLFLKYGLTARDSITQEGVITRNKG